MNFQESNASLDELIKFYLPQDSTITSVTLSNRFGSTFADVHHTVTDAHKDEYNLSYSNRILSIRLITGGNDKGAPISSFADHD